MSVKVSIVIPTYNRPLLLLRCLDALAAQEFDKEEYEIIVVSDGPDAETKKAINQWLVTNNVSVFFFSLDEKRGPAAARNHGWRNSNGRLVAFTDDDCLPDKRWVQSFYNQCIAHKNAAFTGRTIVPVSKQPTDYERNIANLETAEFITANCCCTKSVLWVTGGFDEQFTMAWREDSDLEFKLIKEHIPILKVDNAVVVHPVRQAEWGISIKEQKKTMFNALLYKKYPELYRQKIQPSPPVYYYVTITTFLVMIAGLVLNIPVMLQTGLTLWITLSVLFILRRLRATTLSAGHLLEMAITSLFIPFLSIYWQYYGAVKYRVLFI